MRTSRNELFSTITFIWIFLITFFSSLVFSQTNTPENYFPTRVGTTWVYLSYPDYSNGARERVSITKDSVSITDGSHYIFINDEISPLYRVDTLGNVYRYPLGGTSTSNWLIFKQHAQERESWLMSDTTKDTSSAKVFARISEIGVHYVLGRYVKYKAVEWGWRCSTCSPDSLRFDYSPRKDYFAEGFGWYFAIVEPQVTERWLVGYISPGDTLGDVAAVNTATDGYPSSFMLLQNYPNPFNPSTTISFSLPSRSFVSLKIFDVIGREVATLATEEMPAGNYYRQWNASGMSSGVYFYRLQAGSYAETKRLSLIK